MLGKDGWSVTTATESCQLARSSHLHSSRASCLYSTSNTIPPARLDLTYSIYCRQPAPQLSLSVTLSPPLSLSLSLSLSLYLFEQFRKISSHAAVLNNRPDTSHKMAEQNFPTTKPKDETSIIKRNFFQRTEQDMSKTRSQLCQCISSSMWIENVRVILVN